jgi:hypothetical protein
MQKNMKKKKRPSSIEANSSTGDPNEQEKRDHQVKAKQVRRPMIPSSKKLELFNIIKLMKERQAYHRGDQKKIGEEHNVSDGTIRRIERDVQIFETTGAVPDYTPKHVGRCGRKSEYCTPQINAALEGKHVNLRSSSRSTAAILGVSHSTVLRWTRSKSPKIILLIFSSIGQYATENISGSF